MLCPSWNGGGKSLVENMNKYLKENGYKGLLFCKFNLIGFYSKYNWVLIPQERVKLPLEHTDVFTMVYNCPSVEHLDYQGRMF